MKIKELYKKYINWIVIILLVLCSFKTCQSCSRSRQLEYKQSIANETIGYYIDTLSIYKDSLNLYKDSIRIKTIEIYYLNDKIKTLKGSNVYLRNTNKDLIKFNERISNKNE